jgi:hypothetical protein
MDFDIVATISSPMCLTSAINYSRQLCIYGVIVTDNKLIAGFMESMKIRDKASSLVTRGNNDTGNNSSTVTTTPGIIYNLLLVFLTQTITTKL